MRVLRRPRRWRRTTTKTATRIATWPSRRWAWRQPAISTCCSRGDVMGSFAAAVTWWSAYYSDHQMVSLVIRYLHLAALMVGGGTALAIDRVVLGTARRSDHDRR